MEKTLSQRREALSHHDAAQTAVPYRDLVNQAVWRAVDGVDAEVRRTVGHNADSVTVVIQLNRRDIAASAIEVNAAAAIE